MTDTSDAKPEWKIHPDRDTSAGGGSDEGGPTQVPGGRRTDRELTEDEIREHDEAYQRGWALVEGELLIGGAGAMRKPGILARRRLRDAIGCFETALSLNPAGWQSLWALGKIHQRLGELPKALECFTRAHEIDPSQPLSLPNGVWSARYFSASVAFSPK